MTDTERTETTTEWEWVQGFGWVERQVVVAEVIDLRRDEDERKRA
jgi:hypothetical protein